jgi:hypothetical protein
MALLNSCRDSRPRLSSGPGASGRSPLKAENRNKKNPTKAATSQPDGKKARTDSGKIAELGLLKPGLLKPRLLKPGLLKPGSMNAIPEESALSLAKGFQKKAQRGSAG